MQFIIYIDDLEVKGTAAELIPLGMDIIIVNGLRKFKLTVFPSEKRRFGIFFSHINMAPVIERFNIVHTLSAKGQWRPEQLSLHCRVLTRGPWLFHNPPVTVYPLPFSRHGLPVSHC